MTAIERAPARSDLLPQDRAARHGGLDRRLSPWPLWVAPSGLQSEGEMPSINPAWCTEVIDLSHHHQQTVDWAAAKAAGLVAVIHKATEGRDVPDVWYHKR